MFGLAPRVVVVVCCLGSDLSAPAASGRSVAPEPQAVLPQVHAALRPREPTLCPQPSWLGNVPLLGYAALFGRVSLSFRGYVGDVLGDSPLLKPEQCV